MTATHTSKIVALAALASFALSIGIAAAATTDYASSVADFSQGLRKDGSAVLAGRSDPTAALGAPDGTFVSLGFGGSITLEFPNYVGTNLSVTSYEITNGPYPLETANVEVSADGSSWTAVGTADNGSGAGPNPHTTTFELPRGTCIKYVRITDTTDPTDFEPTADAFDVDAVGATYDEGCTPPPQAENTCGCSATVTNDNHAFVWNVTVSRSSAGDNYASGSKGGSGGSGGDVTAGALSGPLRMDDHQPLTINDGLDGANGSSVVTSGTGGAGGAGGAGGPGGYVETGTSTSNSRTLNVINFNRTRIVR